MVLIRSVIFSRTCLSTCSIKKKRELHPTMIHDLASLGLPRSLIKRQGFTRIAVIGSDWKTNSNCARGPWPGVDINITRHYCFSNAPFHIFVCSFVLSLSWKVFENKCLVNLSGNILWSRTTKLIIRRCIWNVYLGTTSSNNVYIICESMTFLKF